MNPYVHKYADVTAEHLDRCLSGEQAKAAAERQRVIRELVEAFREGDIEPGVRKIALEFAESVPMGLPLPSVAVNVAIGGMLFTWQADKGRTFQVIVESKMIAWELLFDGESSQGTTAFKSIFPQQMVDMLRRLYYFPLAPRSGYQ